LGIEETLCIPLAAEANMDADQAAAISGITSPVLEGLESDVVVFMLLPLDE